MSKHFNVKRSFSSARCVSDSTVTYAVETVTQGDGNPGWVDGNPGDGYQGRR